MKIIIIIVIFSFISFIKILAQPAANLTLTYFNANIGNGNWVNDTKALKKAVDSIRRNPLGGKLNIPIGKFLFNDTGIVLPDNIEIYGAGSQLSEIRNINPTPAQFSFSHGFIFYASTYASPQNPIAIEGSYSINPISVGSSSLLISNISFNFNSLYVGQLILLGENQNLKNGISNQQFYTNSEVAEISSLNPSTRMVYLTQAIQNSYTLFPEFVPLNTGQINTSWNLPYRISKNIKIHDLKLTQADSLETTVPHTAMAPGTLFKQVLFGSGHNSQYYNLYIDSYSAVPGGNILSKSTFSNIEIHANKKFTDLGYMSSYVTIDNLIWHYRDCSPSISDATSSFIYLNEGCHDITFKNCKATANSGFNGTEVFSISDENHNLLVNNCKFDLPAITSTASSGGAIHISDGDLSNYETYVYNLNFTNDTIIIGSLARFLRCEDEYSNTPEPNRNVNITNCAFIGNYTSSQPKLIDLNFKCVTITNTNCKSSLSSTNWVNMDQNCILGINSISPTKNGLSIYPNPNSGIINFDYTNFDMDINEICIYNLLGEMVYSSAIDKSKKSLIIDTKNLPNGIYTSVLVGKNSNFVNKFIKQ